MDKGQWVRWERQETGDTRYTLVSRVHEPVDIDRNRRVVSSTIRRSTLTVRRSGYSLVPIQSSSQDSKSKTAVFPVEPKTLGGTNTFKPFWQNGKPKCRKGYRYDYKRKLCVKE